jgi:acylpyruvate hydrolase
MRLVTIDNSNDGQSGATTGDEILNLSALKDQRQPTLANWIPNSALGIIEGGPEALAVVDRLVKSIEDASGRVKDRLRERRALTPAAQTPFLAPIPRPKIVFSTGRSYLSHDEEMMRAAALAEVPPPPGFLKNTNAIIGNGQPIVLPKAAPNMVDWECEVSFVIGRTCHNVGKNEALDYVVGHTMINDVSARDWVAEFRTTGTRPPILSASSSAPSARSVRALRPTTRFPICTTSNFRCVSTDASCSTTMSKTRISRSATSLPTIRNG